MSSSTVPSDETEMMLQKRPQRKRVIPNSYVSGMVIDGEGEGDSAPARKRKRNDRHPKKPFGNNGASNGNSGGGSGFAEGSSKRGRERDKEKERDKDDGITVDSSQEGNSEDESSNAAAAQMLEEQMQMKLRLKQERERQIKQRRCAEAEAHALVVSAAFDVLSEEITSSGNAIDDSNSSMSDGTDDKDPVPLRDVIQSAIALVDETMDNANRVVHWQEAEASRERAEALQKIEHEFVQVRDALIAERVSAVDHELAQARAGTHPLLVETAKRVDTQCEDRKYAAKEMLEWQKDCWDQLYEYEKELIDQGLKKETASIRDHVQQALEEKKKRLWEDHPIPVLDPAQAPPTRGYKARKGGANSNNAQSGNNGGTESESGADALGCGSSKGKKNMFPDVNQPLTESEIQDDVLVIAKAVSALAQNR